MYYATTTITGYKGHQTTFDIKLSATTKQALDSEIQQSQNKLDLHNPDLAWTITEEPEPPHSSHSLLTTSLLIFAPILTTLGLALGLIHWVTGN